MGVDLMVVGLLEILTKGLHVLGAALFSKLLRTPSCSALD
jgi:hypothetical protein